MYFRHLALAVAICQPASALDALKQLSSTRVHAYGSGGMDFDNGAGELETLSFGARSFLTDPFTVGRGWSIVPAVSYEATFLRYDGTPGGFPVGDEDLHAFRLPIYALKADSSSPWMFGGFFRLGLATDFDHVTSDDLFFDVGGGVGYRLSDRFTIGAGAVVLDIGGDDTFIPGIGFIWQPCDPITVSLLGPVFRASWDPSEDWRLSFDVRSSGGTWNIDSDGDSRLLNLRSWRAGLHAQRRLTGEWWLEGGAGLTFANKVELMSRGGHGRFESTLDRLDNGWYGFLAVKKEIW